MRAHVNGLVAALIAIAAIGSSASAQNSESSHQVRSGVFGQWGIFRGDGVRGGLTEDYAFSSLGIGFAAGIEYVRKHTWSYGIELDGAVHSGEENLLDSRYRPNLSGSLRLRAGQHVRSNLYWYGTFGVAGIGQEIKALNQQGVMTKVTSNRVGFVLGTGLERDFGPGLFFAEYLLSDYGRKATELNGIDISAASHIFRVGVKYKVGYDHYADDVVERLGDRIRRK
jgi:opacity protein-like surface antigen